MPRRRQYWSVLLTQAVGAIAVGIVLFQGNLQAQQANEFQVKAAYLYNFGKFVTWPSKTSSGEDSFGICVLGRDPFGPVLDKAVAGERISGKNIVVKRIAKAPEAADCRVLFVSSSEEKHVTEILSVVNKSGVLTVSDIPQFTQHGGMIEFLMDGNKVRFEVNLTPADEAGLQLSSDLLKVAVAVKRNPAPGD